MNKYSNKLIALSTKAELKKHIDDISAALSKYIKEYQFEIARSQTELLAREKDSIINIQRHKGEIPHYESLRYNHFKRKCSTPNDYLSLFAKITKEQGEC